MAKREKPAPSGCFWRGPVGSRVLWGRINRAKNKGAAAAGGDIRWSLQTDDAAIAITRREFIVKRLREIEERGGNVEKELFAPASSDLAATKDPAAPTAFKGPLYDDVLAKFIAWHARNAGSDETAERYASSLEQIHSHLTGKPLLEIDRGVVMGIIEDRSRTVCNATIRRDLTALSRLFHYAIITDKAGLITRNVALEVSESGLVEENRDPIILPLHDHIELVRRRAPPAMAMLITAALVTGCRQDELVNLECDRVDHSLKQLTIVGKRNKLRTVDLRPFDGYEAFRHCAGRSGWVFTHEGNGRYAPGPYKSAAVRFHELVASVEKECAKDGTPFRPMTFHMIRHRHAVDYLEAGGSIYSLQLRLGHSSVKTTEEYTKYLSDDKKLQVMYGGQERFASATEALVRRTGTR